MLSVCGIQFLNKLCLEIDVFQLGIYQKRLVAG